MQPPVYSPHWRIDLRGHHVDASGGDNEEAEVIVPMKVENGEGSSSTEESLHFSDRV